jgi:hypothetical protein
MVEFADQLDRTLKGMDATIAVIADIHQASTSRAIPVEDIKFPESKIRVPGPFVGHPANLHVEARSVDAAAWPELTLGTPGLLALSRVVDKDRDCCRSGCSTAALKPRT